MNTPQFKFQLPPRSLFKFPPDPYPLALPPPTESRTFASPFPIPYNIYNGALDWKVPVTIGAVYATTAIIMNRINKERGNTPWPISKTKAFHYFVLAHNIFLAVFSALSFWGMIRALAHTWPGRRELPLFGKMWPGMRTEFGLAGAADALCKMHGPKDMGNAVFYSPSTHSWMTTNRLVTLSPSGSPDTTNVGRLWNEGLAFWGWWFYLSKFYEVLDTVIILAKGKRSSTLQTYHHTGAMACMWAGIRYMSPPIWMFCFINSGIHAMMYTYYTLSALRVRVPQRIKRTLTTMQITQFLVGITFATMHLFVHYSVPVSTPYTWTKTVNSAVSAASAAVSQAASGAASQASAAVESPGLGLFLKQMLLRAVGEAGMAKKLGDDPSMPHFHSNVNFTEAIQQETNWKTQYEFIPCIDTQGAAFAVWLNVFYLAPLTLLFVRFFVRSYMRRGGPSKQQKHVRRISQAAEDAAHGVNREVDKFGKSAEKAVGSAMDKINGVEKRRGFSPASENKGQNIGRSVNISNNESTVKTKRKDTEFHNKSKSINDGIDGQMGQDLKEDTGVDSEEGTSISKKQESESVVEEELEPSLKGIEEKKEQPTAEEHENKDKKKSKSPTEFTKEPLESASTQGTRPFTPSSDPSSTTLHKADINDPFTATPSTPYTNSSHSKSSSSVNTQSHIPILAHSATIAGARSTSPTRSISPTRKSKIPKLTRPGSSPVKPGEKSPIKNILTRAKTTPAAVDSTNVTALAANVSGGANKRGK